LSAIQAIAEAGDEFRRTSVRDYNPNAIELTKVIAQQLHAELSSFPDTQWVSDAFDQRGIEYLLGSKIYGMRIASILAPSVRAFKQ